MEKLSNRTIVLGVSGSIAAFKSCEIASILKKKGADVFVVMTDSATHFIDPVSFEAITGNPVSTRLFESSRGSAMEHIELADKADAVLLAPATANIVGKIASGIADDLLSTVVMATRSVVIIAPAMNVKMWENPFVQENVNKLKSKGYFFVGPEEGILACGYEGKGRLSEPIKIVEFVEDILTNKKMDLKGKKILVTAGRTEEAIDPVRVISNRSSGKMGYAIAEVAKGRGADVVLVSGEASIETPQGMKVERARTSNDMMEKVMKHIDGVDALIMAAAVSDFKPKLVLSQKLKREPVIKLELTKTEDILKEVMRKKKKGLKVVGFALETDRGIKRAREKLTEKGLDLIVLNTPEALGKDESEVIFIDRRGNTEKFGKMRKENIAEMILDRLVEMFK